MALPAVKSVAINRIVSEEKSFCLKEFGNFTLQPATEGREGCIIVSVLYGNSLDEEGNLVVEHEEVVRFEGEQYRAMVVKHSAVLQAVHSALCEEIA